MLWMTLNAVAALTVGIPVVAIDAGHGGSQQGAVGSCGVVEKDVTLALAEKVEAILQASALVEPVMVRRGDQTLGLAARAERANAHGAAVFLSIHANASSNDTAHGIETFFLAQNAAGGRLSHLARRENDGVMPPTARGADPALQFILQGLSLDAAHAESQALALKVQAVLSERLHTRGRGVLQAPFMVLLGAHMAAVLVEVGFLTHPQECRLLVDAGYQDRIAEALATAVLAHLAIHSGALAQH